MAPTLRSPGDDAPAQGDRPLKGGGNADRGARREERGTGVTKWTVSALLLGLVVVVILAQNTARTRLNLLWGGIDAPLFAILLLVGLGFAVLSELGSLIWRHQRRARGRS